MERSTTAKASSVDLAVEKALAELGVTRDKAEVEVLSKGGLFKSAEVRVTVRESEEDIALSFFERRAHPHGSGRPRHG